MITDIIKGRYISGPEVPIRTVSPTREHSAKGFQGRMIPLCFFFPYILHSSVFPAPVSFPFPVAA
ncbi:hypothetical protein MKMG_01927 [Methanogenium sp. MK-MG]|nr:hypothetical protein MKMG_01927 [Methanogenium sp. MK-MG]